MSFSLKKSVIITTSRQHRQTKIPDKGPPSCLIKSWEYTDIMEAIRGAKPAFRSDLIPIGSLKKDKWHVSDVCWTTLVDGIKKEKLVKKYYWLECALLSNTRCQFKKRIVWICGRLGEFFLPILHLVHCSDKKKKSSLPLVYHFFCSLISSFAL